MKKKLTLWGLILLGAIILALSITNPSDKSYSAYIISKGYITESYRVQIHSPEAGMIADEYECKPFWGKQNSFLILSTFEYQVDSVYIAPEKQTEPSMTIKEKEEVIAYNANRIPKYYHITKKHMGILSKFYETRSTIEEFKVN